MFVKAERKKAKLRLAMLGPSGSGKTYSALLIAQGLGGPIALIDTERKSGSLYAHLCDYDVCDIDPPYTPDKYVKAIKEAERAGYNVVIVDSLTHAWAGQGGLLEEVDKRKGRGNDFTAWRDITPMHNALVDSMLQSGCHVIATMRTKQEYVLVDENRNGKNVKVPKKVGMAPVQRDGMEYEFTVVFDMDLDRHVATASKARTSLFDGKVFTPSVDTGKELVAWLETGADMPLPFAPDELAGILASANSVDDLGALYKSEGFKRRLAVSDSNSVNGEVQKRKEELIKREAAIG